MQRKKGISFGTILMLAVTVIVLLGSAFVLGRMGGDELVQFDAAGLISAMHNSLAATDAPVATPAPQSTIKTTSVTLAPNQTQAAAVATQEPVIHTFSVTIGGQAAFRSDVSASAYRADTGMYDYAPIFENIASEVYADLNLCTFSNLTGVAGTEFADIVTLPGALHGLKAMGMDRVLLNHGYALDKGSDGLDDMVNAVRNAGLDACGVNGVHLYTVNGVNIAILGYVETSTSKTASAVGESGHLKWLNETTAREEIALARNAGADVVIVSLWWGNENQETVTDHMRDTALMLCQAGADIIAGAGTDALLPVEWVDAVGSDGSVKRALAAYSMGTLISEKRETRKQVCSALLHLRISVNGATGEMNIQSISYTPTYIWKQEVSGNVIFRVLASHKAAPEGMSQKQLEIMGRALAEVEKVMAESPAVKREN